MPSLSDAGAVLVQEQLGNGGAVARFLLLCELCELASGEKPVLTH